MYKICLALSVLTTVAEARCHTDWVVWRNTCFLFSTVQETWIHAELHCRALHAALLEIPDAETNTFVKDHLKSRDGVANTVYFIGATDIAKEDDWEWNGSKTILDVTDWGNGQPDHHAHTENCLALRGLAGASNGTTLYMSMTA